MKYNLVVCGGTFDHFHKGHREFLRYALSIGNKILVGLTSNAYVRTKNNSKWIEDYRIRKQSLENFFYHEKGKDKLWIELIDDIYLPKVWESLSIEAIVVSKDTILAAKKINLRRKEQRKSPLKIEIYPLVKSNDNGYISSSKIRNGEINREGVPYVNPLWFNNKLVITEELRRDFKKPFGTLLRSSSSNVDILKRNVILGSGAASDAAKAHPEFPPHPNPLPEGEGADEGARLLERRGQGEGGQGRMMQSPYLITVGDITTKTFNNFSLNQDISVIDFKVARKKKFSSLAELGFLGKEKIIKIANPAGCLTPALFKAVSGIFKLEKSNRRIIIQIDGEEDLSVLPLTLGSPLGCVIFYGQPGEGVVKVEVSEKSKGMAYKLVSQFKKST